MEDPQGIQANFKLIIQNMRETLTLYTPNNHIFRLNKCLKENSPWAVSFKHLFSLKIWLLCYSSRVFPYTSLVLYRFLRALKQNTAQSRLLYLLSTYMRDMSSGIASLQTALNIWQYDFHPPQAPFLSWQPWNERKLNKTAATVTKIIQWLLDAKIFIFVD